MAAAPTELVTVFEALLGAALADDVSGVRACLVDGADARACADDVRRELSGRTLDDFVYASSTVGDVVATLSLRHGDQRFVRTTFRRGDASDPWLVDPPLRLSSR